MSPALTLLIAAGAMFAGGFLGVHVERRSWIKLFERYLAARPEKTAMGFIDAQGQDVQVSDNLARFDGDGPKVAM
jgi:hypothetical protein